MSDNIWQEIKNQLKAKDVVEHYLGPPQKTSGNNFMWCSPFREGDNDPSLSVKDNYIKDFGGDFSGDIFEFLIRLKNVSKKEALEMLVKDFDLDIDISKRSSNKRKKAKKVKAEPVIPKVKLVPGQETQEILNMFDTIAFKNKPNGRTNRTELRKE